MIATLTNAMKNAFDGMNRTFGLVYSGGLSQFFEDVVEELAAGNLGITANAVDVDSIAKGGGAFSYDPNNSVGLSFGYNAGRINWFSAIVTYAASAITLSASNTNYVEADRDGTIHSNTAAFTAGRVPLYLVVCGSSSIATVVSAKPILNGIAPAGLPTSLLAANSVPGAILSTVGATRTVSRSAAAISATTNFLPIVAPVTGVVSAATFLGDTVVGTDNTNYWTFSITNLGQANAGTQAILGAVAGNTTKATGGNALAINVPLPLTLALTTLAVNKGDVLIVAITKTAAATTIANAHVSLDFTFNN
jgi:hypothetical protein